MPPQQHSSFEGFEEYFFGDNSRTNNDFNANNPANKAEEDTESFYKTLGVSPDASVKEIKTAYIRLSKLHHPDRGGDGEKIKEINAAYEVLSDPSKRNMYDKYGLDGVSEDNTNMYRRSAATAKPRKGPNINYPLRASLEDLYNGKTKKLAINRKVIIGDTQQCDTCNGSGIVGSEDRKLANMFVFQGQKICSNCEGHGETAQTKSERKVIEVHIDKGMTNNQKIRFRNMADEFPNQETGDVNIIIEEKKHPMFTRKGADLLVVREISLNQALCGWSWKFDHLDGRTLVVKTKPGEILQTERKDEVTGLSQPAVKIIKSEGMPSFGNPFMKGDLYIKFDIRFPSTLSEEQISVLKTTLPDPDTPPPQTPSPAIGLESDEDGDSADDNIVEDVEMEEANPFDFGKGGAIFSNNEYDSDNDDMETEPIQCQQS